MQQLDQGNNGAIAGTEQYLNSLSEGVDQLYSGLSELEKSYGEFNRSIGTLADTLSTMFVNVSKLSDGTGELKGKTSGMNEEIENKMDDMLSSIKGSDSEAVSFVWKRTYR